MWEWLTANWATALPIFLSVVSFIYTSAVWKKQRKLDDGLARSKAAYDIILKKEFSYYENIDPIYAKLIPGVQDIAASLQNNYPAPLSLENRRRIVKKELLVYLTSIKELKSFLQSNDIYLSREVSEACGNVIGLMQANAHFFSGEAMKLWEERENEIDNEKCQLLSDLIVLSYVNARSTIKQRLDTLANT